MKKIFLSIRALIIGFILGYGYFPVLQYVFVKFWKFDILTKNAWIRLNSLWNQGLSINSPEEYYFFTLLMFTPVIFILLWYGLCKIKYLYILMYPFNKIEQERMNNIWSKRAVLKNLGSKGKSFEQRERDKLKANGKKTSSEVSKIKEELAKKLEKISN